MIWSCDTVRLLPRWDVWQPHTAPYPDGDDAAAPDTGATPVQVGPAR